MFGVNHPGLHFLDDAQSVPAFFDALKRLQRLSLVGFTIGAHGQHLLHALSESSSLTTLRLTGSKLTTPEAKLAFGEALALLLLKTTSLEVLVLRDCELSTAALQPMFAAFGSSKTLRELDCSGNDFSSQFALWAVLPAVRLNTSLRELVFNKADIPALVEAEALVKARSD